MRKLLFAVAVAMLLASLSRQDGGTIIGTSTQGQTVSVQAKNQQPNYGMVAPDKELRTGTYYNVCSADFALAPHERRDAIRRQLKANPSAINRIFSSARTLRAGINTTSTSPKIPLKLSDIESIQPGSQLNPDDRLAIIKQHTNLALIWGQKWPNGSTLHVRFLNTDPSWKPIKDKVAEFAHKWEEFANVTFSFDDDPSASIRILLTNDNFSWSAIGTDAQSTPSNQETMHYGWFNLQTPDEEYSRTVIHEFGHVLGAIHEQQHPDADIPWNKPAVYAYYASANPPWDMDTVDLNMFKKYDKSILQYGAYDKDSIMQYPIPPTFTTNGFSVGWNTILSTEDKAVIAWVYPKVH